MVRLSIMGRHNVLNAMVALAVADLSGVPLSGAVKCLAALPVFRTVSRSCRSMALPSLMTLTMQARFP